MTTETKVYVLEGERKGTYRLRWTDPRSGKWRQKTVRAKSRAVAEKLAGKLAAQVDDGRLIRTRRVVWTEFKQRYLEQHVATLAEGTQGGVRTTLGYVERLLGIRSLEDLDAEKISGFLAKLREKGLAPATVNGHARNLRAALRWAVDMELLARCPKIRFARTVKGPKMKGGHVSEADFLRTLEAVPHVVPTEAVESWRFYLRGLWESGLRLKESLALSWDAPDRSRVDLSVERREKIIILGEFEKGRKNRVWPMPPGFVVVLKTVPVEKRTGPIFTFAGPRGGLTDDKTVSRTARRIFEHAGVQAASGERSKRATLHDLRRSFILRMKRQLANAVDLQRIARHEDINTTLDFYVGDDDAHVHATLWAADDARKSAESASKEGADCATVL